MTLEFLVERWEDQRTIKNLMGKYVNCLLLNRQGEIFDSFFSTKSDVCLTFNDGSYIGPDAVKGYFDAIVARNLLSAQLLQKRLPEKLGGKSDEELYGIGPFHVKPLTAPVIEVAEDGETAKAFCCIFGYNTTVDTRGPVSNWIYGTICMDFVYENDQWKILHMQYLEDINAQAGSQWGKPDVPEFPELAEFESLRGLTPPEPGTKVTLHEAYSGSRSATVYPPLPKPYTTFAETFSYGI